MPAASAASIVLSGCTRSLLNGAGKEATGALRATGLVACKRHGLARVWVTDDGQCFDQENNARAHHVEAYARVNPEQFAQLVVQHSHAPRCRCPCFLAARVSG